ncbi:hypothetical protein GQ53DRAFT_740600 [Thozetella sp. PMI_491]|nr:hypothetical protein GQ53DRAFT_740600 [Thozetella sp. PMI_491]
MCFFEQSRWSCGSWKWGTMREQCNKETRIGETCGLKLIFETFYYDEVCKTCEQISRKLRRIEKMTGDIERWKNIPNRTATIEKTQRDVYQLECEVYDLRNQHHNTDLSSSHHYPKRQLGESPDPKSGSPGGYSSSGESDNSSSQWAQGGPFVSLPSWSPSHSYTEHPWVRASP